MQKNFTILSLICFMPMLLAAQWNGSPAHPGTPVYNDPSITGSDGKIAVPDGSGGSIVVFTGDDGTYVQRISANGVLLWNNANNPAKLDEGLDEDDMDVLADGIGGVFITASKEDEDDSYSYTSDNVYLYHINSSGHAVTPAGGVKLSNSYSSNEGIYDDSWYGQLCSDGAGGVIVMWTKDIAYEDDDDDNDETDHYYLQAFAQRCNSNGTALWAAGGIQLSTAAGLRANQGIVADGAGGAIVFFLDTRNSAYFPDGDDEYPNIDIYAQGISAAGARMWTNDGKAVCTAANIQYPEAAVSDGVGGALLVFSDYNNSFSGQRINSTGAILWPTQGVMIFNTSVYRYVENVVSNGAQGMTVQWYNDYGDEDSEHGDYAQQITKDGTALWPANGILLNEDPGSLQPDGSGNYFYGYYERNEETGNSTGILKVQKYSAAGLKLFNADGITVCNNPQYFFYAPELVPSNNGSMIMVYIAQEQEEGVESINAKKIESSGVLPLILTDFTAIKIKVDALLNWATASETYTLHFEIERSGDNQVFSTIGKVAASGNSSTKKNYVFTDLTPLTGNNYYRLKMVDKDGAFTYSAVKLLNFNAGLIVSATLVNNPVRSQALIRYESPANSGIDISVIDMAGKRMSVSTYQVSPGVNMLTLETGHLLKGIYEVQVVNEKSQYHFKMMKE